MNVPYPVDSSPSTIIAVPALPCEIGHFGLPPSRINCAADSIIQCDAAARRRVSAGLQPPTFSAYPTERQACLAAALA